MHGLMQRRNLLISSLLEHADRHHGAAEVVSRRDNGALSRTTYGALAGRARKLARVLIKLGVRPGDRVATLAMNSDRHLELYYAISGIGAICNTINPRLSHDDIAFVAHHAEDGLIFVDPDFLPIIAAVAPRLPALRRVVVLADAAPTSEMSLPGGIDLQVYEALLDEVSDDFDWPPLDENSASGLCYTSGTTGRPKGVLYSHRSTVLHAMMLNFADVLGLTAVDRLVPLVPMFHVHAWGLPFAAPMAGAALIFPGRHLDPPSLLALLNGERASIAVGVPTIWLGVLAHLRATGAQFSSLKKILVGGAAIPRALIVEYAALGVRMTHAWGMTECSPVATCNAAKPQTGALDPAARTDQMATQGRTVFGIEVEAHDDLGNDVPRDGVTQGNLVLRGHWVASGYYRSPETQVGPQDWFATGDVGVIDAEGFVTITDRTKDLIKSGGEWISSIALENIAVGHPEVAEAAAIAVPHDKWGERPLLVVVARPGCRPEPAALRDFFADKVPKWSIPDRVVIVESIPHGATGKILKSELRRMFSGTRCKD
jgi:3-(methylthio)propionyl---CoA ligase